MENYPISPFILYTHITPLSLFAGPKPKIERLEMDGTHRMTIISHSIQWPNGLTIDYTADRIYWSDAKHHVIESSSFDGTSRRKVSGSENYVDFEKSGTVEKPMFLPSGHHKRVAAPVRADAIRRRHLLDGLEHEKHFDGEQSDWLGI